MKTFMVSRHDLLKKLDENKEKHREIFLRAIEKYRELVIQELERSLEDARKGVKIRQYVGLLEPQDHTKDYLRVITALQMETREVIEISEAEFAQYVMDDWAWKQQWASSTLSYTIPDSSAYRSAHE
jgi:hypothetical protein